MNANRVSSLCSACGLVVLALCSCGTIQKPTPINNDSSIISGNRAGDPKTFSGIEMCWCPAGEFVMGSPRDEPERRPGENQVNVTLTRGFWIGKFEVTQGEWRRIVGEIPGVLDKGEGDRFPMYDVNFAQCEDFCAKATALAHASGDLSADWEFRLPTDAQWEYACRAGTTTATPYGDSLSSTQANFLGHTPYNGGVVGPALDRTCEVGQYAPNAWGMYDMVGNVFEWCRDWYHDRAPGGVDPDLYVVPGNRNVGGSLSRVRRGGCWADVGWPCRSAFRLRFEPERGHSHIGFRVIAVQVKSEQSFN